MLKFDILPQNLKKFLTNIKKDKNFKAMAVTMPYKKAVLSYLDELDQFAKTTGAVNLIIKKKNKLFGYNTDVYGAYVSIKKFLRHYNNIIIIGMGGTGQAIFNFLVEKFKKKNFYLISSKFKTNRNKTNIKIFKKLPETIIDKKVLIINCTPLGSDLKKKIQKTKPL